LSEVGQGHYASAYATGDMVLLADWHRDMAATIRACDPYRHLVTTSSPPLDSPIWDAMDYAQIHRYAAEMIAEVGALSPAARDFPKPVFFGEIGDHRIATDDKGDGRYTRSMLWAGLMSGASGAAQVWAWDDVDRLDFYPHFAAAGRFLELADIGDEPHEPTTIETSRELGALALRAESGFALWVYSRAGIHAPGSEPVAGRLTIADPAPGIYSVMWFDTDNFDSLGDSVDCVAEGDQLNLDTPPIARDAVAILRRNSLADGERIPREHREPPSPRRSHDSGDY
jgi:hypothetical protein